MSTCVAIIGEGNGTLWSIVKCSLEMDAVATSVAIDHDELGHAEAVCEAVDDGSHKRGNSTHDCYGLAPPDEAEREQVIAADAFDEQALATVTGRAVHVGSPRATHTI